MVTSKIRCIVMSITIVWRVLITLSIVRISWPGMNARRCVTGKRVPGADLFAFSVQDHQCQLYGKDHAGGARQNVLLYQSTGWSLCLGDVLQRLSPLHRWNGSHRPVYRWIAVGRSEEGMRLGIVHSLWGTEEDVTAREQIQFNILHRQNGRVRGSRVRH